MGYVAAANQEEDAMRITIISIVTALLVGCGISDDKPITEIDADLWDTICNKAVDTDFCTV